MSPPSPAAAVVDGWMEVRFGWRGGGTFIITLPSNTGTGLSSSTTSNHTTVHIEGRVRR